MIIRILGTGCAKCKKLEENVLAAVAELGLETSVEKVTEMDKIMDYGVMITPALVFGEKVVSFGKLLSTAEIVVLLQEEENIAWIGQ